MKVIDVKPGMYLVYKHARANDGHDYLDDVLLQYEKTYQNSWKSTHFDVRVVAYGPYTDKYAIGLPKIGSALQLICSNLKQAADISRWNLEDSKLDVKKIKTISSNKLILLL